MELKATLSSSSLWSSTPKDPNLAGHLWPLPHPQHVALCIKLIAAWFVPDVPQSVKNKVLEEKYQTLRKKMW